MADRLKNSLNRTTTQPLPPAPATAHADDEQARATDVGGEEETTIGDAPTPGAAESELSLDELDVHEQEGRERNDRERAALPKLYEARTRLRREVSAAMSNLSRVRGLIETKERRALTPLEQGDADTTLMLEILREEAPAEVPTTVLQQHLRQGAGVKAALRKAINDRLVEAIGTGLGTKYRYVGRPD